MQRTRWLRASAALALITVVTRAGAQAPAGNVIDQQNVVATGVPVTISNPFDFVRQTFTPTADQISGFGISFTGPITTFTSFNVLVGLANGSESPLLSRLFTLSPSPSYSGFDATFTTPAPLMVGALYVIALGLRAGSLTFQTGDGDPYAGGVVSINGIEQPGQDLVFRTFAPAPAAVVPEPGTFVLVGAGLAAAAGVARRRRAV